jgi:hypothetical protein
MAKGTTILFHHMRRFGLLMHIGQDGKNPRQKPSLSPPNTQASLNDRDKIIIKSTDQGYTFFNRKFTYLGSVITNDLDDSVEINVRIGKANDIIYSLVNFWRSKGLTVKMKKAFYIVTIMNILLWSCKSLTIRKEDLNRLEVFHHSAIRYIFNISKWQQATTRLSNKRLRRKFNIILNMQETINERRLDWLGNIAWQPDSTLCKKFHTAWIQHKRTNRGQKTHPVRVQCNVNQQFTHLQQD